MIDDTRRSSPVSESRQSESGQSSARRWQKLTTMLELKLAGCIFGNTRASENYNQQRGREELRLGRILAAVGRGSLSVGLAQDETRQDNSRSAAAARPRGRQNQTKLRGSQASAIRPSSAHFFSSVSGQRASSSSYSSRCPLMVAQPALAAAAFVMLVAVVVVVVSSSSSRTSLVYLTRLRRRMSLFAQKLFLSFSLFSCLCC